MGSCSDISEIFAVVVLMFALRCRFFRKASSLRSRCFHRQQHESRLSARYLLGSHFHLLGFRPR
jgi:hypothetical protein